MVVKTNETAMASAPSGDFQGFQALGRPTDEYRSILVHLSRPVNPDDSALRYYFHISLIRRDVARSIATEDVIDSGRNRAENEQIGPTVVILSNGTPPSSREGTIYDSLVQVFTFDGLVTVGHVNETNFLFLWCSEIVCKDLDSNIIAFFVREAGTFRPQIAALQGVEAELASLDGNLSARLDDDAAHANFSAATRLSRKLDTKGDDTPTDLEYSAPFPILRLFRASDARQTEELEARRENLQLAIVDFKERVGRAQDSHARQTDRSFTTLQTWAVVGATIAAAFALVLQAFQTRLQRKEAREARETKAPASAAPSPEKTPPLEDAL
ncbi:MAG: hypothetical protein WDA16_00220 [Candidatus Thermoplasmatota archaeon]